jgi:hypothetical protein
VRCDLMRIKGRYTRVMPFLVQTLNRLLLPPQRHNFHFASEDALFTLRGMGLVLEIKFRGAEMRPDWPEREFGRSQ